MPIKEREQEKEKLLDDKVELKRKLEEYREREKEHKKLEKWYKIATICLSLVMVILLLWQVIVPIFVHGSTDVIAGGGEIELKSETHGYWNVVLFNDGRAPSKNIVIHVEFQEGVKIDYDTLRCIPTPDSNKTEEDNEIEYEWNYLDRSESIWLYFEVSAYSLIGKTKPLSAYYRIEGEGGRKNL